MRMGLEREAYLYVKDIIHPASVVEVRVNFLFYSVSFLASNNFRKADGSYTLTEDFI